MAEVTSSEIPYADFIIQAETAHIDDIINQLPDTDASVVIEGIKIHLETFRPDKSN